MTYACSSQWPEAVSWVVLIIAATVGYVAYRLTGGYSQGAPTDYPEREADR